MRLAESGGAGAGDYYQYRIAITTGTKMGAGTDARVTVGVTGETGEEWAPVLQQRKESFEKGRTDTFICARGSDMGELKSVTLKCENPGVFGDSWYCEKVSVSALDDGREW